jgi:hypothetical protein
MVCRFDPGPIGMAVGVPVTSGLNRNDNYYHFDLEESGSQ